MVEFNGSLVLALAAVIFSTVSYVLKTSQELNGIAALHLPQHR